MAITAIKSKWHQWPMVVAAGASLGWAARLIKRVFVTPRSESEVRATEKERQRQVLRGLRGLKKEESSTDKPA